MLTAQQWAQKWATGMEGAADRIRAGVNGLQSAPGAMAALQVDKMRANWLSAIDSGRWQNSIALYPLDKWKQLMIQKGIPNITNGVRAAQPAMQAYAQRAIPIYQSLMAQIAAMPKRSVQDSKARVGAWIDGMIAQKQNLRGD